MLSVFHYIESIAERPYPVLVTGESGTGKELVPPVIHALSRRKGRFVKVNVGGVDDATFSDTLFGHAKGAYTGADTERKGLVDEAQGGTLFLDEIGELSPASQVKLLRLLANGDYRPLGTDREKISDARIIVATNAELAKKMEQGLFRTDLYHRFTYIIPLPSLRERKEDIPLLLSYFISEKCESLGMEKPEIKQELIALLASYGFPGNVRELETMAENALARHSGNTLSHETFKEHMKSQREEGAAETFPISAFSAGFDFSAGFPTLEQVKESLIEEAIRQCQGNLTAAAHMLGVTPGMLSRRKGKK
jgi:DNA-binding NtrC family response regulator